MANRRVTKTGKDNDGDITSLCGSWGMTLKWTAISEIDNDTHTYYVNEVAPLVLVRVVRPAVGLPYLRTVADRTSANNLDNLPDC